MDDESLVAENAREVLATEFDRLALHAFYDGDATHAERLWRLAVEMGWLAASAPERLGGLGLGAGGALSIAAACGARAVPGALQPALVVAAFLASLEADDSLDSLGAGLVEGALRPAVPALGRSGALTLRSGRAHGRIDGVLGWPGMNCALVPVIDGAREALAAVELAEGQGRFEPLELWDRTRSLGALTCEGARIMGTMDDPDGRHAARLQTALRLAVAADAAGGGQAALDLATEYTKERRQFGRPVGSFQALKHRIADLWIELSAARKLFELAKDLYGRGDPSAGLWAAIAKPETCEAYAAAAQESVLLHGAVGYTWEFDCHVHVKRARLNALLGGDARAARDEAWEALASGLAGGASVAEIAI